MSLLKANSVQIGQSSTATNNFTLSVPASPDGTIKLARGNSGATTADVLSVNASGEITGATISGATINSSTINGGSITLGTAQNSTSGTAIDFTGIPSWAKRVTVMLDGVSASGTNLILVQIGSGGITSSGYNSSSCAVSAGGTNAQVSSSGFVIYNDTASDVRSGHIIISLLNNFKYIQSHSLAGDSTRDIGFFGGGSVSLSGAMDRVRIATTSTDTFDAGSINIMYEG